MICKIGTGLNEDNKCDSLTISKCNANAFVESDIQYLPGDPFLA